MSGLSSYPSGLLNLVGAQTMGENPRAMSDAVVPILQLNDLYAVSKQVLLAGVINPAVNGFNSLPNGIGPVPPGELWWIRAVSASVVTAVGGAVTFTPAIRKDGAVIQLNDPVAVGASLTRWAAGKLGDLFLAAGDDIGIYCQDVAAAPIGAVTVLFVRLRA